MFALILATRQRQRRRALTRQALLIFIDHLLATHPVCTDTVRLIFGAATTTDIGSYFFADLYQGPYMVGGPYLVIPLEQIETEDALEDVQ